MRNTPNVKAERLRVAGPPRTNCGAFQLRNLRIIVGDGMGWDHVSVSTSTRCPTWEEMCEVKELFFRNDECAMQLHPPKADWINCHPFCLHLWKPQSKEELRAVIEAWRAEGEPPELEWETPWTSPGEIPRPPAITVGIPETQEALKK